MKMKSSPTYFAMPNEETVKEKYKLKRYNPDNPPKIIGQERFQNTIDICLGSEQDCYLVIQHRRVVGLAFENEGLIVHLAGRTPLEYPTKEYFFD